MDTRGSFPGGKAAGAWSWTFISIWCRGQEWVELYLHSPNMPSWRGAQLKHRNNFTFTTENSNAKYKQGHHKTVLSPTQYNLYNNNSPYNRGPPSPLRWCHMYIHKQLQERSCSQKAATGLKLRDSWCESWNIRINGDKTRATYFCHSHRPVETQINGLNIPLVK
jgi:hypothetical protein